METNSHPLLGKPPAFGVFTSLDFALIALLERINCKVIQPKITEWRRQLCENESEVAVHNLAAGFLAVWPQLGILNQDHLKQSLESFVWGEESIKPLDALGELLDNYGHFLFNSYYYVLINEFGEIGLVPIIPGFTYRAESNAYEQIQKFIQQSRLPLHINEKYFDTYSALMMPLRAGITPQFLQLYLAGVRQKPTYRLATFLGDLAILQKREDFVHRHFSALMVVLDKPINHSAEHGNISDRIASCFGSFVLTSVVPDAFNEKVDEKRIQEVGDWWSRAPLQAVHSSLRRTSRGIHRRAFWSGSKESHELEITNQQIRDALRNTLENMVRDGVYLLWGRAYESRHERVRLAAINVEGLDRLFACQFPSGPSLDPTLVFDQNSVSDRNQQPVVNVDKLKNLCVALDSVTSPDSKAADREQGLTQLLDKPGFSSLMKAIFPDVMDGSPDLARHLETCFYTETVYDGHGKRRGRLIVLRGPAPEVSTTGRVPKITPRTQTAVQALAHDLTPAFDDYTLPGTSNLFLARIRRTWNEIYAFTNTLFEEGSSGASRIAQSIRNIMNNDTSVRGVILLTERQIYIPEPANPGTKTEDKSILAALLQYPSFWLFESLCHLLAQEELKIDPFRVAGPLGMWAPPFRSHDNAVTLVLSEDDKANQAFTSALTYFGISVSIHGNSISRTPLSFTPVCVVNPQTLSRDITTIYRNHLKARLALGTKEPSLERTWAGTALAGRVSHVSMECVQGAASFTSDPKAITFTMAGDFPAPLTLKWKPHATCDVAFAAFAENILLKRHLESPCDYGTHRRFTLGLSTLSTKGNVTSCKLQEGNPEESNFSELFKALNDEITKLKISFRSGSAEQQIQLAHEIRGILPVMRSLFTDPRITSNTEPDFALKVKQTHSALRLMHLHTALLSGFLTKDYVFPSNTPPLQMASELIDLGITEGVRSSSVDLDEVAPAMEALLVEAADRDLTLNGLRFRDENPPPDLLRRLKSELIILTMVANAAKHLSTFIFNRICHTKPDRLPDVKTISSLFTSLLRVEVQRERIVVHNLGTEMDSSEFTSRFRNGAGKTHDILRSLLSEEIFGDPGDISLKTFPPKTPVQDASGKQLDRISIFEVAVTLPSTVFVEMPR